MPDMPLDAVTWCEPTNYDARGQQLEGPCLYGLAWWIWLLLILGFCCCTLPVILKVRASHKVGITPGRVVSFWEAVMLANHAYPHKSRLKGRPMQGISPLDDLVQAQNCCCCLSLHKGLLLLSLIDLGRLGIQLALAIDSLSIYQQTEGPDVVPNADPRLAGLMDPELRRVVIELCIAVIIVAGTKVQPHAPSLRSHPCEAATLRIGALRIGALCIQGYNPTLQVVLWLSVWFTTLTIDLINPLRALMVWALVDLLNTACFTTGTSMLNRDLCLVDIAIYNARLRVRAPPPPWQCPTTAPVLPQDAPGGSGRLGTPRWLGLSAGRPGTASGAKAAAASKVAEATNLWPSRPPAGTTEASSASGAATCRGCPTTASRRCTCTSKPTSAP